MELLDVGKLHFSSGCWFKCLACICEVKQFLRYLEIVDRDGFMSWSRREVRSRFWSLMILTQSNNLFKLLKICHFLVR